jgi:hypothetical protein
LPDVKASIAEWTEGLRQYLRLARQYLNKVNKLLGGNRPAVTLLCYIDSRFIRVDVNDKGALMGEPLRMAVECDAITDLPAALQAALKEEPIGRRLWLLHDGVPNYTVEVPVAQVTGLSEEQIDQALLFELQELTGVVTTNLQSSHVLLAQVEGQNQYWLNHAPKTLIAQLQRVARECGCQLAGLLHPAGLPQLISTPAEASDWARLEVWPDVLVGVSGDGMGRCKAWVIQANAKPKRVQAELERWRGAVGDKIPWESLGDGMAVDFLPTNAQAVNLDQADPLALWLAAWGQTLAQTVPTHIPLLLPPEDPNRERWLMSGGAALAVAVCLLHLGWQHYRMHRLDSDKAFLQMGESQIKGMESEISRYKMQHDDLIKKLEPGLRVRTTATPEVLAALRQRLAALLRELAVNVSDGVVVEEIRTKPDAMIVKGVSLDAVEANKLASALETRLHGLGWRIEPPRKKDLALDAKGGPWEFEILLTDTSQPVPADVAKNPPKGVGR